jgi:hypothetical protein
MYRVAAIAAVLIGVVFAAGAQASPADNSNRAAFEARAAQLEAKFDARSVASASPSRRDLRGPKGKKGAKGPRGPKGAAGPVGPKGTFGAVIPVDGPSVTLCSETASCAVQGATASCPPGTIVVGGGWKGGGIETFFPYSAPVGNSWSIIAVNWYGNPTVTPVAMCAS